VITGFGRLGEWFAATLLGVTPDLLCVAKGISGGYAPLSATLIKKHVADAFWGAEEDALQLRAGYTYGGNPVSAAVGLAAIAEIRDRDLVGNARRMGERLRAGLERIRAQHPSIVEVRGTGLLYGLLFNRDLKEKIGARIARRARSEGLLIREGPNLVVMAPPLVVTAEDIDDLLARLESAIGAVETELALPRAQTVPARA
jgi:adenosylmethionine-8-amino-7-oxononanoate aminotransferase